MGGASLNHMNTTKDIRLVVLDSNGYETRNTEYNTMKEARQWVKDCGLRADYWDRSAEVVGFHKDGVATIQLLVNGECLQDWFPAWSQQ